MQIKSLDMLFPVLVTYETNEGAEVKTLVLVDLLGKKTHTVASYPIYSQELESAIFDTLSKKATVVSGLPSEVIAEVLDTKRQIG